MADPREPTMDPRELYREEIYTDRKLGTLRVMQPVRTDGSPDATRATLYIGEAQLMTNMGPLPISFEIEATSLADAVARYGDAAKVGVEQTLRELQEMRRQASSSLIVPPAGAASALTGGGGALGGLPGGGLPGGGKIQLP
ncbi:MAG: hypothetical protein KJ018_11350 [Burkholderiales bacterium]|nr:hypothetical protein [Burkholderiales bacterium]GIK86208.1 MAG: hypothetical protein BroJett026_16890 [Betaproteobacteria bacterium]